MERGGGLSRATGASVRGDFGEDGWVPTGGKNPLSSWFLARVVLASTSSVEFILLGWVKSAVGRAIAFIYSSETLCICWSSRMRSLSSGVLDEFVSKFWGNLTYYESPSLSPELAADVTSPSGSAGILGVAAGPSVGCAQLGFI